MTADRATGLRTAARASADGDRPPTGWRRWGKALGPGLVTGAADDDPSTVATYAQAGAKFGVNLLWTSLITLPLMAAVQEICDRTAMATGKSLGGLARKRFGTATRAWIGALISALLLANVVNIAADLVAAGEGMHLIHAGPSWIWSLAAGGALTVLLTTGSFQRIELVFKALCFSLLAYTVVLFVISVNWGQVAFHTVVPHVEFTKDYLFVGMIFAQVVMFGIITSTATSLGAHGPTGVESAAQAAQALKPVAGPMASTLFALGFIGGGMLAVPVLAGSVSVGLSGLTGKPWGLSQGFRSAPFFYGLLVAATVIGTALMVTRLNPIRLLVLSVGINGVAAAPFLALVMILSDDRRLMGEYRNGPLSRFLGWFTVALMSAASITLVGLLLLG